MGTNFYAIEDVCPHCGRGAKKKHIGKSSYGWRFALHVYPEEGIHDLGDWVDWFCVHPDAVIEDEDGNRYLNKDSLFEVIMDRAEWGPEGEPLCRHEDDHCIGHGDGPWDYIVGDFC